MCHADARPDVPKPASQLHHVQVALGQASMPVVLAEPEGEARGQVVVLHDFFGVSAFYRQLAGQLADLGWRAWVPDLFFRVGPLADDSYEAGLARRVAFDDRQGIRDLRGLLGWRRARQVGGRIGTMGFCMGGTMALDLSAEEPDLATVSFYGFPQRSSKGAAATDASGQVPQTPRDRVGEMQGPILGWWGEDDELVGTESVLDFAAAAAEAGTDLRWRLLPGLGHGFLAKPRDTMTSAEAAEVDRAWTETLDFLAAHVG